MIFNLWKFLNLKHPETFDIREEWETNPLFRFAVSGSILALLIYLEVQLFSCFIILEEFRVFMIWMISDFLKRVILPNILLFSILLEVPFILLWDMSENGFLGNTAFKYRGLFKIFVAVFPLLYFYGWYCIYNTESAAFIIRTVEVELKAMMSIVAFYICVKFELVFYVKKVLTPLYPVYHTFNNGKIIVRKYFLLYFW